MDPDSRPESTTKEETKYPCGMRLYVRLDRPSSPYFGLRTVDALRETENYSTAEDRFRRARKGRRQHARARRRRQMGGKRVWV
mgnify:CR=1 FL=1